MLDGTSEGEEAEEVGQEVPRIGFKFPRKSSSLIARQDQQGIRRGKLKSAVEPVFHRHVVVVVVVVVVVYAAIDDDDDDIVVVVFVF